MDTVVAFNSELSALYETKPPISKAKMASITRSAMKAIKFYKHVVQSVEKFILKCKSEYKVPGLYVIDSIVRQSRHQFGPEKDVFAPRFARNMLSTFANLFRCAPEDKSKIIRVLNLWQKNNVFAPDVIQPLFDLADPNHPMHQMANPPNHGDVGGIQNGLNMPLTHKSPAVNSIDDNHTMASDMSNPIGSQFDSNTIRQLQQLKQILIRRTGNNDGTMSGTGQGQDGIKFNNELLDYDYGDDDDDDKTQSPRASNAIEQGNNVSQLLNDPNVVRQLQNLQKLKNDEMQNKLTEMRLKEEAFEKHLATVLKKLPFANECDLIRSVNDAGNQQIFGMPGPSMMQNNQMSIDQGEPDVQFIGDDSKVEVINLDGNDSRSPSVERDRYKRSSRRTRSRSRDRGRGNDRRRGRSRSRSRSRSRGRRRSSRDRMKDKERDKEREKEREYERERKRKGIPEIKKEHLSVCSTTLWVGHLSKLVQQEELSDTFGKYGDIVSIDMIIPRGCAFIVMNRRQDAYKAMCNLKHHKLQGRAITISWAAGKGVKSKEWKDYWDIDLGVSYIPWGKLNRDTDMESLEEGGWLDEDSMPEWLKEKIKNGNKKKSDDNKDGIILPTGLYDASQPPPGAMMPGVPMVTPFTLGGVPRLMAPMGLALPGNMVPGLPLGVPPPQLNAPMMLPPGMSGIPPPPIPSMDKSVPPPNTMNDQFMAQLANFSGMAQPMPPTKPNTTTSDDQMDLETEEEQKADKANLMLPQMTMGFFNRPPPHQLFGMPGCIPMGTNIQPPPLGNEIESNQDRVDNGERDRSRDRDGNRRPRDGDRNRGDFNRDNDRNPRWGGDRESSRDRGNFRDRRERDKQPLSDRLRDMVAFSRRGDNGDGQWQDQTSSGTFNDGPRGGPRISGPPSLLDGMGNDKGFRGHFGRGDGDFDRRGQQRDFFGAGGNRFGHGNRNGPMMGRGNGPQFNNRTSPMFMRGGARQNGPQGYDRPPFFDREDRGMNRNRGGSMNDRRGGNRPNWREDNDDNNRRGVGNRFNQRDNKRQRWGNNDQSPTDGNNDQSNDAQSNNSQQMDGNNHLDTEPIDEDSQEDDFNDFDDNNQGTQNLHNQQNNYQGGGDENSTEMQNNNGTLNDCQEGNTTPLYDEQPHDSEPTNTMNSFDEIKQTTNEQENCGNENNGFSETNTTVELAS